MKVEKPMQEDDKLKEIVIPEIKKGIKWYLGKIFSGTYTKKT